MRSMGKRERDPGIRTSRSASAHSGAGLAPPRQVDVGARTPRSASARSGAGLALPRQVDAKGLGPARSGGATRTRGRPYREPTPTKRRAVPPVRTRRRTRPTTSRTSRLRRRSLAVGLHLLPVPRVPHRASPSASRTPPPPPATTRSAAPALPGRRHLQWCPSERSSSQASRDVPDLTPPRPREPPHEPTPPHLCPWRARWREAGALPMAAPVPWVEK